MGIPPQYVVIEETMTIDALMTISILHRVTSTPEAGKNWVNKGYIISHHHSPLKVIITIACSIPVSCCGPTSFTVVETGAPAVANRFINPVKHRQIQKNTLSIMKSLTLVSLDINQVI